MEKVILKGITWGHSRGITPLQAYGQRFNELYPAVEVLWKKRSLQEFADYPLEQLTSQYDLLIIDHPWVGTAAATGCVFPLDEYFSQDYLDAHHRNSVGNSHISYQYNGHQWALAIDAATPVSSYRPDVIARNGVSVPQTWADVMEWAKQGWVAAPAIPIDLLMNFYMFCIAHGNEPFAGTDHVIDLDTGLNALETMRAFYSLLDKKMFSCNPIAVAELMTKTDDYYYCPFAYGYSNYARKGYAMHVLQYDGLVDFNGKKLRSTIGGTGIAVSSFSNEKEWAFKFLEEIVSERCQSTFYVQHGGQPGNLAAWTNEDANRLCNNYFTNVLPAMQQGYMRPRYHGYLNFQDRAGEPLQHYLMHGGDALTVLNKMNHIYHQSLQTDLV